MLWTVDVELVTEVDQLQDYVAGWEALADRVSEPRASGAIVAGWARHMKSADVALRIWIALDGAEVVGVLPFASEGMTGKRLRLVPPATDMLMGVVPIVDPERSSEAVAAVADAFAAQAEQIVMASIFWLPEGSPWAAFGNGLVGDEWVTTPPVRYSSSYTDITDGIDAWLAQRDGDFRREVRRRGRRGAEQGFRIFTTVDRAEIIRRLPLLQAFYLRRKEERGGKGYRFDEGMYRAIENAVELSSPGRFAFSVLERDGLIIGMQFVLRSGRKMSSWMTGHDPAPEWSRLGTGIATLIEALGAGAGAGCKIVDLGVGDEQYKETFVDGQFPLESVTWCRPRLARLLRFEADTGSA
jgi:CelD/BcsL family acetyltransferase involved in cellulose biosynthesis